MASSKRVPPLGTNGLWCCSCIFLSTYYFKVMGSLVINSVYWYEDIATDHGDYNLEWRFDFAPGEFLGLYRDDEEVTQEDYPDEWEHGARLASEPYS